DFTLVESVVESPGQSAPRRVTSSRTPRAPRVTVEPAAQRQAGLATLDRLLSELADGGLAGLGRDKRALLAQAGELVRSLKLRRLGSLLLQFQRLAAERHPDQAAFARLLGELWLTRATVGAHLDGRVQLDPRLAEDLLGKTW